MTSNTLDRVYQTSGDADLREVYDEWALDYDRDLAESGYLTPGRVAETLAALVEDRTTPILDYACGTGLSGAALAEQGFTTIDGADLSAKMLEVAEGLKVYRQLYLVEPDQGVLPQIAEYGVITAVGAISKGAAPAVVYDGVLDMMQPGALLIISLNDLSLADAEYGSLVPASVSAGKARVLSEEHGPHLAKYGKNSGSTIYVIERLG